jgi:fructose-specific phosphotransferase system IIC component
METSPRAISHTRFLIAGTLVGGVFLSVLGFVTAALLPPRFKPFRDPAAVVETIRANTTTNEIYTAPQGLFVAVSVRPDGSNWLQNPARHLAVQVFVECAVAFCLSLLVTATIFTRPMAVACFLGFIGAVAGAEVHVPESNWAGFPITHTMAALSYLAANWFITGLVLGALRLKLDTPGAR